MKPMRVLLIAIAAAALAAPVSAQFRPDDQRGRPERRDFPQPRETHPLSPQPNVRGPVPVPTPRPGWGNDSLGAGWSPQQDEVRRGVTQKRFVPLGQAIETIRRRGPGRELDAGLEQWNGRAAYRVRWAAPDGQRIDYIVDAESGAILSVDGGR